MKRAWQVKVKDCAAFTMILMTEEDDSPEHICKQIFGDRLEWVR